VKGGRDFSTNFHLSLGKNASIWRAVFPARKAVFGKALK
jgi:hypothetical protein